MTGRPRASLSAPRARHGDSCTALTLRAGLDGVAVGIIDGVLTRRMGKERIVVMVLRHGTVTRMCRDPPPSCGAQAAGEWLGGARARGLLQAAR
jgi:hypothetical protein